MVGFPPPPPAAVEVGLEAEHELARLAKAFSAMERLVRRDEPPVLAG